MHKFITSIGVAVALLSGTVACGPKAKPVLVAIHSTASSELSDAQDIEIKLFNSGLAAGLTAQKHIEIQQHFIQAADALVDAGQKLKAWDGKGLPPVAVDKAVTVLQALKTLVEVSAGKYGSGVSDALGRAIVKAKGGEIGS